MCQSLLITLHVLTHLISQQPCGLAVAIPILTDELNNSPEVTWLINRRSWLRTFKVALTHLYILPLGCKGRGMKQLLDFLNAVSLFSISLICGDLEKKIYILKCSVRLAECHIWYLILPYFQSNKSAYYCFTDTGRRHETSRSETIECGSYSTASSMRFSQHVCISSPCSQVLQASRAQTDAMHIISTH